MEGPLKFHRCDDKTESLLQECKGEKKKEGRQKGGGEIAIPKMYCTRKNRNRYRDLDKVSMVTKKQ